MTGALGRHPPLDSIFRGEIRTARGRALAWADALLVDHAIFRVGWINFAAVVPGQLYRSNHPLPFRLAALTRRHGLRSLVNLRGPTGNGADALSRAAAERLGLDFIDLPLSSKQAPTAETILRVRDAYATMRLPALVHCKSGADRAGFAAALFLLFQGGDSRAAQRQLTWRHGHITSGRAGILDAFLHRYRTQAEGRLGFVDWVRTEYDPAALQAAYAARGLARFVDERVLARE